MRTLESFLPAPGTFQDACIACTGLNGKPKDPRIHFVVCFLLGEILPKPISRSHSPLDSKSKCQSETFSIHDKRHVNLPCCGKLWSELFRKTRQCLNKNTENQQQISMGSWWFSWTTASVSPKHGRFQRFVKQKSWMTLENRYLQVKKLADMSLC